MTCLTTTQLHRYHDRQLPAPQIAEVESHLRTCAHCRAELQAISQVGNAVSQARMAMPDQRMMRRWARSMQYQNDRQLRHLAEWAMAAAAAIVLGFFGLWPSMDVAQAQSVSLVGNVEQAMLLSPSEESLPANVVTARMFAADLAGSSTAQSSTGSKSQ